MTDGKEQNMLGVYLSGTGNTKHCISLLLSLLDENAELVPIEDSSAAEKIKNENTIVLAYPTQFSNVPYMVRDFINRNSDIWNGKNVLCMTTMGAFSGDGAGCSARILKKYGASIIGGLHIRMPDAVCDNKMLKKPAEENRKIVEAADIKIRAIAKDILESGRYPQDGLSVFSHLCGLFGQRLWFYNKTTDYSDKLKISDSCTGCGICAKNCPMGNLSISEGKAVSHNKCAMCYRCISSCPKQAITLLGKQVYEQCRYEKYAVLEQ